MFGLFIEHRFIRFEISKSIPFRIITFAMGIMLFFFPFIISLILGYGKAEYIGNTAIKKEN